MDPGLVQTSIALSLRSRGIGEPVSMHNPSRGGYMITRYDEGPRCIRKIGQEYKHEPLVLRRRNEVGDYTEWPSSVAAPVRDSLNLDLYCRTMVEMSSYS